MPAIIYSTENGKRVARDPSKPVLKALTNTFGGTADGTIADAGAPAVGVVGDAAHKTTTNSNLKDITEKVNELAAIIKKNQRPV